MTVIKLNGLLPPLPDATTGYDEEFLDDMFGLFPDAHGYAPKSGGCGKYIYDGYNWDDVLENTNQYYPSQADHDLMQLAISEAQDFGIPADTTYMDFGVGGVTSFRRYAVPLMHKLRSKDYLGVDFCTNILQEVEGLRENFEHDIDIKTQQLDLFFPTNRRLIIGKPALGVMNGLTITNIYDVVKGADARTNLLTTLKYLAQLSGNGWLLVTIDTNQDVEKLADAYQTTYIARIILSVLYRMKDTLPVKGFDPSAFVYEPQFHAETQALMHMARATSAQVFQLGPHQIHVEADQKIHLLTSYKWRQSFFEEACDAADLSVLKRWKHPTGVMLYLLKDQDCLA